ncbi:MerR family transcriptional regulator [Leptolinea tardivitalis]|uniref:HTH merR-type domain-containing protein n=1 Tax=Leptolinea tardivitalis TaxID=229920 RepID=A0A0P6X8R3_9CHLR|nr:MerR family transcriptional regulator [Leptolinea tardivitalis]KPL71567.1 hypothetical protein ADM99_08740 [Leptolinea tardivitalis]GAP19883.1 predicted transcriptional regulator [Leptolinea tardivitalis]
MEYSIGDVSKISRVSGKTLHQYHQEGLVLPTRIDKFTSRRYFDEKCFHRIEIIHRFHRLGIPLEIIKDVLTKHRDTRNLIKHWQTRIAEEGKIGENAGLTLDQLQSMLEETVDNETFVGELKQKTLPMIPIASISFHGKQEEIHPNLQKLMLACGGISAGEPFVLFHDDHQYDEEMDIDCCLPVREKKDIPGIVFRDLPGAKAVTVTYQGPTDRKWMGYKRIIDYLNKHKLAIQSPSREVYLHHLANPGEPIKLVHIEIQFLTGDPNDPEFKRDIARPGYGIDAAFDL